MSADRTPPFRLSTPPFRLSTAPKASIPTLGFRSGGWLCRGGSTMEVAGIQTFSRYPGLVVWLERQLPHENEAFLPVTVADTMTCSHCELHSISRVPMSNDMLSIKSQMWQRPWEEESSPGRLTSYVTFGRSISLSGPPVPPCPKRSPSCHPDFCACAGLPLPGPAESFMNGLSAEAWCPPHHPGWGRGRAQGHLFDT